MPCAFQSTRELRVCARSPLSDQDAEFDLRGSQLRPYGDGGRPRERGFAPE